MFDEYSRQLLRSGIIEVKAGNYETGRRYLDRALYLSADPDEVAEGWYWMSQAVRDPVEKRKALENCLVNNLQHPEARRALAVLDGRLKPEDMVDPNMPAEAVNEDLQGGRYVCPRCGGRMTYAPDGRALVCEYCQRHEPVRDLKGAGEADFVVAMATRRAHNHPLQERVLRCEGCGAQFFLSGAQIAFTCAYCGSAMVLKLEQARELIAPDGILPHAFDGRRAQEFQRRWIEERQIQPAAVGRLRGLYLPAWSFTLSGGIDYTGEVVTQNMHLYGVRVPAQERVQDRYPVSTTVAVAASNRAAAPFAKLLSTYNPAEIKAYSPDYLADWPAELYDTSLAEASLEARSRAYADFKRTLPTLIAPVRLISSSSAPMTVDSFALNLLPVWMGSTTVAGSERMILINGQNGVVQGDATVKQAAGRPGVLEWLGDLLKD